MEIELREIAEKIGIEITLDRNNFDAKEELLQAIQVRVSQLLHSDQDLLFSYLYRLDVSEKLVREALTNSNNAIEKLARLIFNRQLQRLKTKKQLKQKPIEGWEW